MAVGGLESDQDLLRAVLDSALVGTLAFRAVRDGGAILDLECVLGNATAGRLLGAEADSLRGRRMRAGHFGGIDAGLFDACVRVVETGEALHLERRHDGEGPAAWFEARAVRWGDGVVVSFSDVAPRKRAEADIELFLTLSQDLICVAGMDGYFKYVNPAWESLLGYTNDELLSRPFLSFIHPEDHRKNDDEVVHLQSGRPTRDFENRYVARDGSVRIFSWTAVPLEADGLMYCIGRDVTERRRAEEALAERERVLRTIVDHVPAWLALTDAEGRYLLVNRKYSETFGKSLEQMLGRRFDEVFPELKPRHGPLVARCQAGEVVSFDDVLLLDPMHATYVHGVYRPVWGSDGKVAAMTLVALDVTEARHMEEQVLQAQKMQALGTLASGIAHDFNNLLTAIGSHAGFLRVACEQSGLSIDDVLGIEHLRQRGAALTQKLLALGRRQMARPVPLDLNALLRTFVPIVRRLVGERIEVTVALDAALPAVEADPAQIEQALLNLVANARDVMPAGGSLDLATRALPAGAGEAVGRARLSVRDSGPGIPPDVARRIFEPFFTTKEVGRGTGLGLAVVHGIVQHHRGTIEVVSEVGAGTEFQITLPGTARAPVPVGIDPCIETASRVEAARAVTILLAEDDPDLGFLLRRVLAKAGYTCLLAIDGEAAVATFRAHADEIALVVLDMVMPRLEGQDALREMRRVAPGLRAVLISGYSEALRCGATFDDERALFLPKPFANDELLAAVERVLRAREGDRPAVPTRGSDRSGSGRPPGSG